MIALRLAAVTVLLLVWTPLAKAELKDAQGKTIARAELIGIQKGVLIRVHFIDAPAGDHAFHIHAVGKCEAPSFESAGPHFNPTKAAHGWMGDRGPHAGDLPNLHIPENGTLDIEILAPGASIAAQENGDRGNNGNNVLDGDGASLVLHAAADDYMSDPAGNAGARVACGVIR